MSAPNNDSVVVRSIHQCEADIFLHLLCDVFELEVNSVKDIFYQDPFFQLDHKWALFVNGEMKSILTVTPAHMKVNNAVLPVAGIAGVATKLMDRKHGYGGVLIQKTLESLAGMGYCSASLYAHNINFYRRFGFDVGAVSTKSVLPNDYFFINGVNHECRAANETDLPAIVNLHKEMTQGKTGCLERDNQRWNYFWWNNRNIVVWGDPVEAYLVFTHPFDSPDTLMIQEGFALRDEGYKALTDYIARISTEKKAIEIHCGDPFLKDIIRNSNNSNPQCIHINNDYTYLFRITNIERTFNALNANYNMKSPQIIIKVNDPYKEQTDTFAFPHIGNGIIGEAKTDITSLSKLVIGITDGEMALDRGWVLVDDNNTATAVKTLFPFRDPTVLPADKF